MIRLRADVQWMEARWRISKSPSTNTGFWRCSRPSPDTGRLEFGCSLVAWFRGGRGPGLYGHELQHERGPATSLVGGPHPAAVSHNDRAADRQTQSQTC